MHCFTGNDQGDKKEVLERGLILESVSKLITILIRVPVIWSKFEFLNQHLAYEIILINIMKNGFRFILALTETRLHHFEV